MDIRCFSGFTFGWKQSNSQKKDKWFNYVLYLVSSTISDNVFSILLFGGQIQRKQARMPHRNLET